jgi:hypothetical protein
VVKAESRDEYDPGNIPAVADKYFQAGTASLQSDKRLIFRNYQAFICRRIPAVPAVFRILRLSPVQILPD